jgi:stearoyl-CoA desaturase (delta-9 desaturase)
VSQNTSQTPKKSSTTPNTKPQKSMQEPVTRRKSTLPPTPSTTPPLAEELSLSSKNIHGNSTDQFEVAPKPLARTPFFDEAIHLTSPPQTPGREKLTNDEKRKLNDPAIPTSYIDDRTLPQSLQEVNWVHFLLLTSTPIIALYGMFVLKVPLLWQTALFSWFYYFFTGMGITAGYHRYWAHKSYSASPAFEWLLCFMGSGAVEGSIRWWSRGHRQHHRYTDTPKDPYSAALGIFWSHVGWMLTKEKPEHRGTVDISDLGRSKVVNIQHQYYPLFALMFGVLVPTVIPGLLWGDWMGGYFYSAILRLVVVHHATFCVNSLAHWLGEQAYDDRLSPRNSVVTALVTMGEGYHNFHHEFPHDFRNGIKWYHYDPTKWLIASAALFGFTWDLHKFPEMEIEKGVWEMKMKQLEKQRQDLDFGTNVDELPVWSWEKCKFIAKR